MVVLLKGAKTCLECGQRPDKTSVPGPVQVCASLINKYYYKWRPHSFCCLCLLSMSVYLRYGTQLFKEYNFVFVFWGKRRINTLTIVVHNLLNISSIIKLYILFKWREARVVCRPCASLQTSLTGKFLSRINPINSLQAVCPSVCWNTVSSLRAPIAPQSTYMFLAFSPLPCSGVCFFYACRYLYILRI